MPVVRRKMRLCMFVRNVALHVEAPVAARLGMKWLDPCIV